MSFEIAVQQAIYDKLTTSAPVMNLISAVRDHMLQNNATFPYITIGEASHAANDTDTTLAERVTATIHVWSRQAGRAETKQIQGAIFDALNRQPLTATGYIFEDCLRLNSQSFIDADGITRHGVQQFLIRIRKT